MKRILWIALAALLVAACGGKKSRPAQSSARPAPRTFRAVTVPSTVPPEERRAYLRDHYWDNFDFRDTTLLAEVDTVSSPWLDRWERIAPQHDLRMASQNRIGRPANDFRYTTADGATRRMYDIRAEYLLLFINNPGCNMCKTVREAISASPMLNELIERGKLKVLALFPDEDLTEWQEYRPQIPARWINAYDKGCVVRDRELYDLKAIPALYLLDRDKRVMVKDAVDVGLIEWAIDHDDRKN